MLLMLSKIKDQRSKVNYLAVLLALSGIFWGCSENEAPTAPGRTFSGITQRNEWGDTLSVDSTDWVIVGGPLGASGNGPAVLPCYRNGKLIGQRIAGGGADLPGYSIGAFPNPFIPQAGHLLIDLVLLAEVNVNLHLEDEPGQLSITLMDTTMPAGLHTISWNGEDASGQRLPDGIYRFFFNAIVVSSFGDVEVIESDHPDPAASEPYVLFAQEHYDSSQYAAWEYQTAVDFGADGELGGNDGYTFPQSAWSQLSYELRFLTCRCS